LDLPRNRVELEGQAKPSNPSEVQGKEIEKQGAVGCSIQGVELGPALRICDTVNVLETRRLASHSRAVVDDLDLDLAVVIVELDHSPPDE
jgi:hypothetical protein